MNSKNKETEIFELEKKLIKEYFNGVRPRTIKIVDSNDFLGRASTNLEISRDFLNRCTKEELINLLKHELIHYKLPREGHYDKFIKEMERVGLEVDKDILSLNYEEGLNFGCIKEGRIKNGVITTVKYERPRWGLFEEVLYRSEHQGYAFRMLRNRVAITQRELAHKAEISLYMLRKIENSKDLYRCNLKTLIPEFNEDVLKALFHAIVDNWMVRWNEENHKGNG